MHSHHDPIWAIVAIIVAAIAWHFFLRWLTRQNNIGTVAHVLAWVVFCIAAVFFMHIVRIF
jgi:hypothetical protein